jgi:hypothetical protein
MMMTTKLFRVGTMRLGHALIAALTILAPVNASAQALYGSLVGNVVDESGAVVPGATVAITQKETNQTREQATPVNGAYSFPNLAPGTYDVVVTLPGFRTFATRDITVSVGAIVRVDARLALGSLEESVVVTAEAIKACSRSLRACRSRIIFRSAASTTRHGRCRFR